MEARYKEIRKGVPDHVTLVAAAKTRTVEDIRAAIDAGIEIIEKYICYFPMENSKHALERSEGMVPDVVVKVGSPEEFMPLIRTITRLTGRRVKGVASGVGAMCGECTAIPMLTGKPNISLGCGGSRPHARLAPDQMFLAMPIEVYRLLCSSAEAAW